MKSNISNLLQLEYNCKNCESYEELRFLIVNQTRNLISYEYASFLSLDYKNKLKVESISDISTIDRNSVFVQSLESLANKVYSENNTFHVIEKNELIKYEIDQIKDIGGSDILFIPITISKNGINLEYVLMLFRNKNWEKKEQDLCSHLINSYRYYLYSLLKNTFKSKLKKGSFLGGFKYLALIVIVAMFIPVKLTVLAPLEVQAKDPSIVSSSLDGVIDEIMVEPNQFIEKNTLIVKLNDLDYSSKFILAKKSLNIVKAKLYTAQQASFYDANQKNQIENLKAEVLLKEAELDFVKEQLDKTRIYSKKSGIAIIHNPNDWEGKPVVTGERIFQIANKDNVELKIMLPVSDAIFLKKDALVKAFFDNDPLNSWGAKISSISYKPQLTEQNILSYKINAKFDNTEEFQNVPAIGLRGTAKIYSEEVSLFFYLFKKPITSLRQLIAW